MQYWLITEDKFRPTPYFNARKQIGDIRLHMRSVLMDWLSEASFEFFQFQSATYYIAINLIDRVMGRVKVTRETYQLLGVACLMLAAKFHEVYPPKAAEYCDLTDNAFNLRELLGKEFEILTLVNFSAYTITCFNFLPRIAQAGDLSPKQTSLAEYILELTSLDYVMMIGYEASLLAAASVFIVRELTMRQYDHISWSDTLEYYTTYTHDQLAQVVKEMMVLYAKEQQLVHTYRLYAEDTNDWKAASRKFSTNACFRVTELKLLL